MSASWLDRHRLGVMAVSLAVAGPDVLDGLRAFLQRERLTAGARARALRFYLVAFLISGR